MIVVLLTVAVCGGTVALVLRELCKDAEQRHGCRTFSARRS